ncbi:MAG: carboxypeptidase regulatory-like domain-containing protein [Vulcanimicrobiaceae bacterium]|jgi:hypothetical protein
MGTSLRRLIIPAIAACLGGCIDPNYIGVQDYGSVNGRVIDAKTRAPLNGAIVSVGSLEVQHTVSDGSFLLNHVPAGAQTLLVQAPGYRTASVQIEILKGQVAPAGLVSLPSGLPGAGPAPISTILLPAGVATPQPSATTQAAPSPSPGPSASPAPAPSPSAT